MTTFLSTRNFTARSSDEQQSLSDALDAILKNDYQGNFFALLGMYQRILADNQQRRRWPGIHKKLDTLFKCGTAGVISGPMIGIPVSIRDSDYFKKSAQLLGKDRSLMANIEWMATAWNATYADTGLWMGKTFEPVARDKVAKKTGDDAKTMSGYDPATVRIGRNFFREPPDPNALQAIGLPALTQLWKLKDRPMRPDTAGFDSELLAENLAKEKAIPYSKTGGYFLCNMGTSVVPEMNGKQVYQLNYRWPGLGPVYPMTRLIDEIVRIDDGIYLGQLVFATHHYSLGTFTLPDGHVLSIGDNYPYRSMIDNIKRIFPVGWVEDSDPYDYQNNGFFLMVDPAYAKEFYADNAFPQLRPRPGEIGYNELGYAQSTVISSKPETAKTVTADARSWPEITDWAEGWKKDAALQRKFTTFILEESPKGAEDGDVRQMRQDGESILQMLQRISAEISAQSNPQDNLKYFEKLNRLFRCGVAPTVENGLFQGHGERGYNVRADSQETAEWYGATTRTTGFDYYHGATLNLHCGFAETFCPDPDAKPGDEQLFPGRLAGLALGHGTPNALNLVWHSIGKYIFPWAGKSYEKISGRKLSMLLDESDDLAERYTERVHQLKTHIASAPHYVLVEKNKAHFWDAEGVYARHLKSGAWDRGMSDEDKAFWENEAAQHWVDGCNIQDKRIIAADALMRIADMNYRVPDASLQAVSESGPSPFARQGYIFLGVDDRESILPMNNGSGKKKKVFQFHYRFPMIGGPVPIGFCLDEIVEIADGLYLGQLIYSTALDKPFHSSVDPAEYRYQLFGYFLLLDDAWQYHRLAIGLDTLN
jgi:hypothetical protein